MRGYEARKDAERQDGKLQLHKDTILKNKARDVLDAITAAVARDIEEYQVEFRGIPEKQVDFQQKPSGGFSLHKSHYPSASVECAQDFGTNTIVARYASKRNSDASISEKEVRIRLGVDANDEIIMETQNRNLSTVEDVSRFLIEQVLLD